MELAIAGSSNIIIKGRGSHHRPRVTAAPLLCQTLQSSVTASCFRSEFAAARAPTAHQMLPHSRAASAATAAAAAALFRCAMSPLHQHRHAAAHATSLSAVDPEAPVPSTSSLPQTPHAFPRPMLTLERAIGASSGSDDDLIQSGAFAAEVFPDLPIATTWRGLLAAFSPRPILRGASHQVTRDSASARPEAPSPPAFHSKQAVQVTTVAVNLRSMKEVEQRMLWACDSQQHQPDERPGAGAGARAGALLFVSGSHPIRSLPGINRLLPSSITALQLASKLRDEGKLPPETSFWAVSNPNLEKDASLLEAKVQAGARVILTQPPFDQARFQHWMEDVRARGLPSQAKILLGMPCVSSPSNLAFWLSLAGCMGLPAAGQLLSSFQLAAGNGKEALAVHCKQYNETLCRGLLGSEGVSGLHVMPISPASRRIALDLVNSGALTSSPRSDHLQPRA